MAIELKPLRDEFATLHAASELLFNTAAAAKVEFTAEEKTADDKRFERMTQIQTSLAKAAKLAEFAFANKTENVENPSEPAGKAQQKAIEGNIVVGENQFDAKKFDRKQFNRAVSQWLSNGDMEKKFATITSATQSGILMPTDVMAPITPTALNVFREALAAYGMDPWKTPSTRNFNLPIFTSASGNGGAVVSGTATSETEQEPALTESIASVIATYGSGSLWFQNSELLAVDFDLMSASVPAMAYAKELSLEAITCAAIIADAGITQHVATATVSGFTYGNLVSLNRKLPKRYQSSKVIVLSKDAYTAAENLTTTTGFPILNQDAQNQNLKRFNGTPVVFSENFAAFGANAVVGMVFSFIGMKIRDAGPGDILQRYTQTPSRPGQTGVALFGYHAINYTPLAVATLVCPAS